MILRSCRSHCSSLFEEIYVVSTPGVEVLRCSQWVDSDDDRIWCGEAYFPTHRREYIEVVKGDLQWFFVLDFNDQAMNRYFKKYSDPEEARANPPHLLVGPKQREEPINRVELFWQTHVRDGTFVLQTAKDAHSQLTPEGTQPFSGDEICEIVLGRRSGYLKGLGQPNFPGWLEETSVSVLDHELKIR
ncbi:CACTA en-spm transposon protein [Cucumis melo var. makuwa]|uniref:CACTA en-spm transposon protein n=1 Tax=Cucumis melo var. makuwa TaxID=1194695 RepID=A0A5A7SX69_CUCMM|nr:CACTA en-spm transposon protein [Cucumis melo var. makuwa]TYK19084.1 CACTA en-spm transposon protein [Cucumis melo var. makuwa]